MNKQSRSNETLIGSVKLSLNEIAKDKKYDLLNNSKIVGSLSFGYKELKNEENFLDYLKSGWEINLYTAIDFTGSNGDPNTPKSLHCLDETNQYE